MKDFVITHRQGLFWAIYVILCALAIAFAAVLDYQWAWSFFVLALLGLVLWYILERKWQLVCPNCGRETRKAEKYCSRCGSKMELKRIPQVWKTCSNGHRIEDRWNLEKFCPKCGQELFQEISQTQTEA